VFLEDMVRTKQTARSKFSQYPPRRSLPVSDDMCPNASDKFSDKSASGQTSAVGGAAGEPAIVWLTPRVGGMSAPVDANYIDKTPEIHEKNESDHTDQADKAEPNAKRQKSRNGQKHH